MRAVVLLALVLAGVARAGSPADEHLERWRRARSLQERLLIVGDLAVTPGSTRALAQVLTDDPDEAVRLKAAGLLAAQRTDEAVRALLAAITRPDPFVSDAALRALVKEGVPAATRAWLVKSALRDQAVADRQALVASLVGALGCADAVPGLLRCAGSRSWRVRAAAAAALGQLDAKGSASALRQLAGDEQLRVRVAALEALGGAPDELTTKLLRKTARTDRAWQARLAALRAVGPREEGGDRALARAIVGDLDQPFQVRSAAVQALAGWRDPRGVEAMVEALPRSEREVARLRAELTSALTALTGQTLDGREAWVAWWKGARPGYAFPAAATAAPAADEAAVGRTRVRFYGLTIESDAPLFVIDVSGSMGLEAAAVASGTTVAKEAPEGPSKLSIARAQLRTALEGLPPGAVFGLLLFNHELIPVAQQPVKASRENVQSALDQLDAYVAGGSTDLYRALEAVFHGSEPGDPDAAGRVRFDTLVLLSDGLPTLGTVTDADELRRRVAGWNRWAGLRIHTVGLGEQDRALLEGLALDAGGKYVVARQ